MSKRIAILASGAGTNAENIVRHFQSGKKATVALILCNNPKAGVLRRAEKFSVPYVVFNKQTFYETDVIETRLKELRIDLIVLAGFLWLLPAKFVEAFQGKIINIHPALLPKYGGKGFYGMKVHQAVLKNGDKKSGITIHYVNEEFDDGRIIAQFECDVNEDDTPETLAAKISRLEYKYYPEFIERLLEK